MTEKAEVLRHKIVEELRDQGFDVTPQLLLPVPGLWYRGQFFSFDELDTSRWGYSEKEVKHENPKSPDR
jgi:hypothetical protein